MRRIAALMLSGIMMVAVGCSRPGSTDTTGPTNQGSTPPPTNQGGTPPSTSQGSTPPPGSKDTAPKTGAGLVSSELTVKGIGLGSSRTDVEQALGKPDQVDKAPQQNLEFYVYARSGLVVGIALDKVHILSVKSPSDVRTAKGIGIGSTMADVQKAYGSPEPPNIYRLQGQGAKVRLEVESDHDKVTELYFAWGFE